MTKRGMMVLFCAVSLISLGCSDESSVAEIEEWATSLVFDGKARARMAYRLRYAHPLQVTIEVLDRLYHEAETPEDRARVLRSARAFAEVLFGFPESKPLAQMGRESLFDPDPQVAQDAAFLVGRCGTLEDTAVLIERLRSATDAELIEALYLRLAERDRKDALLQAMTDTRPGPQDAEGLRRWRAHTRSAMRACLWAYLHRSDVLRDFGPALVNAAETDPHLAGQAVLIIGLFRAEGCVPGLRAAFGRVSNRLEKAPVAAALIAFDDDASDIRQAYLKQFREAVARYRGDTENWHEVTTLARWLGFASAQRPDWDLLMELLKACQVLKARDRAEALATIGECFVNHKTNHFLYVIHRPSPEELGSMMRLEPKLESVLCDAIESWPYRPLPEGVEERRMREAVVRIHAQLSPENKRPVPEYYGERSHTIVSYFHDGERRHRFVR